MFIEIKNKKIKNILTNYIFKFLFEKPWYKKGDYITLGDEIIVKLDDSNGNLGNLKYYFKLNGFWNYYSAENNIGVNKLYNKVINTEHHSCMYKNCNDLATKEEIDLYNKIVNEK